MEKSYNNTIQIYALSGPGPLVPPKLLLPPWMGISGSGKHSSKSYLLCWIAVHNYFSYPKKKLSGNCEVTSDTSVTEAVFMPVHKVTSVLLSMVAFSAVFLLVKFLLQPIRMFEKGVKSNLAFL